MIKFITAYIIFYFAAALLLLSLFGCVSYNTSLDTTKSIALDKMKKGETCSHYLFGSLKLPYIGNLAIKYSGSQSAFHALQNGNISNPVIVDRYRKNYFFYSKRCIVVYGE